MTTYDIDQLERQIENVEDNDDEAHKLYNNLGLAFVAQCKYRDALHAHRNEKKACKRLLAKNPQNPACLLDLAIAYRRCGDVMLKVDRLVESDERVLKKRIDVLKASHSQHQCGLRYAREVAASQTGSVHHRAAIIEVQAALAAAGQSALAIASESRSKNDWITASSICVQAASRVCSLPEHGPKSITRKAKQSMMLGASINFAITLTGVGNRKKAHKLLVAIALRAHEINDQLNYIRALSNLGEEASIDEDWKLCVKYVREWIRITRDRGDEADEADALRKLAIALRELEEYDQAKEALERAIALGATRDSRDEARNFLTVVEQEIEDQEKAKIKLGEFEEKASAMNEDGDFVGESKATIEAGNQAFFLKQYQDVIRFLQRYFELVDDYGCNPSITSISEPMHNTAVANMGEAMWKLKRYEEAIQWATRELTAFEGDVAGQAQAFCNLGVYLDDFGKKDRAEEALLQSINLAKQCGDDEVKKRAEANLELIHEEKAKMQQNKPSIVCTNVLSPIHNDTDEHDISTDMNKIGRRGTENGYNDNEKADRDAKQVTKEVGHDEDQSHLDIEMDPVEPPAFAEDLSIVDISNHPNREKTAPPRIGSTVNLSGTISMAPCKSVVEGTRTAISGRKAGRRGAEISQMNPARVGTTADHSSSGFRRIIDLASHYKSLCAKQQHPPVSVRPMIVNALKSLSSSLLAKDACETVVRTPISLNLSAMFLSNEDLSLIFRTLSFIGDDETLLVDMSLNPLLSSTAYECLNPRSYSSPSALFGIKELNLSAAGMTPNSLRTLSEALKRPGSLQRLTSLNISKNRLGLQVEPAAHAIADIMVAGGEVQTLDLSLNLLPNTFLEKLVSRIHHLQQKGNFDTSTSIRRLYLYLNNRPHPTALLQTENIDDMKSTFSKLFLAVPSLELIDVRACGANGQMRKNLHELASSSLKFAQSILTVSENIVDNFL